MSDAGNTGQSEQARDPFIVVNDMLPTLLTPSEDPPSSCSDAIRTVLDDDDLLFDCLLHLDVLALVVCMGVNRRWRQLARAERAWVARCAERWEGKHVPWEQIAGTESWFDRYVVAERLALVQQLTTEELQRHIFLFSDGVQKCLWRTTPSGERRLFMDYYPPLRWSWNGDGTLQVEHFQPHTVVRLADWGWKIYNDHIHMITIRTQPPQRIQEVLQDPDRVPRPSTDTSLAKPSSESLFAD
mmetsp:Transcript_21245/g.62771  ORF Transcript_21245/g.62771 Transcript_21245/m.62771 type:complete len:242 (+) Transcript_21245:496-1221(+)